MKLIVFCRFICSVREISSRAEPKIDRILGPWRKIHVLRCVKMCSNGSFLFGGKLYVEPYEQNTVSGPRFHTYLASMSHRRRRTTQTPVAHLHDADQGACASCGFSFWPLYHFFTLGELFAKPKTRHCCTLIEQIDPISYYVHKHIIVLLRLCLIFAVVKCTYISVGQIFIYLL